MDKPSRPREGPHPLAKWWQWTPADPALDVRSRDWQMKRQFRFWDTVYVHGKSARSCWTWFGTCNDGGYGQTSWNGDRMGAHKLAYRLRVGAIPDGLVIDHLCRERRCVRPSHLEAVTPLENFRRGEHPAAKEQRALWAQVLSLVEVCRRLGVPPSLAEARERKDDYVRLHRNNRSAGAGEGAAGTRRLGRNAHPVSGRLRG
jgi:hypothetical protein